MDRIEPLKSIIAAQSIEVQHAIRELEDRGLMICAHFGTENAIDILGEMNQAFSDGTLYAWLARRCGIVVRGQGVTDGEIR